MVSALIHSPHPHSVPRQFRVMWSLLPLISEPIETPGRLASWFPPTVTLGTSAWFVFVDHPNLDFLQARWLHIVLGSSLLFSRLFKVCLSYNMSIFGSFYSTTSIQQTLLLHSATAGGFGWAQLLFTMIFCCKHSGLSFHFSWVWT